MINKLIGVIVTAATVAVIVLVAINWNQRSSLVPFFRDAEIREAAAAAEKADPTDDVLETIPEAITSTTPASEPADNAIGVIPPAEAQNIGTDSTAAANVE